MLKKIKHFIKERLIVAGLHAAPKSVYSATISNQQYQDGRWDYLEDLPELERYSVIVGYCHYFFPEGHYLDIGCGEGVLQQRLSVLPYSRYRGLDLSEVAIEKARRLEDKRTSFVAADAETYTDESSYDVIIFNECLYYFPDSMKIMKHYQQFLKPGGIFVVSMYQDEDASLHWKVLERHTDTVTEARVVKSKEISWDLKVIRLPA